METASLAKNLEYNENRPAVKVLLDSETGKEIRIAFKKGQEMKKHQAPLPIVVEVFRGKIKFGVDGQHTFNLEEGDLITLDSKVPHDLLALEDSIVRLSLNKLDSTDRVKEEANA